MAIITVEIFKKMGKPKKTEGPRKSLNSADVLKYFLVERDLFAETCAINLHWGRFFFRLDLLEMMPQGLFFLALWVALVTLV